MKVFISYVREEALAANWIASELTALGLDVWLDKGRIQGGSLWWSEISRAINEAHYFVPLLSSRWEQKEQSVAREELRLAIARADLGIVPVRLDECSIPSDVSHIHAIDFFGRTLWDSMRDLSAALGIGSIRLDHAEPLALGLPARLAITNGAIKTELTEPVQDQLLGTEKQIMRGELFRAHDQSIRLHLTLRAPFTEGYEFDRANSLDEVAAVASDRYAAVTGDGGTVFNHRARFVIPRGSAAARRHMGLGPFEREVNVETETLYKLVASPRSLHGIVDTVVNVSDGHQRQRYTQWAIVQAATMPG